MKKTFRNLGRHLGLGAVVLLSSGVCRANMAQEYRILTDPVILALVNSVESKYGVQCESLADKVQCRGNDSHCDYRFNVYCFHEVHGSPLGGWNLYFMGVDDGKRNDVLSFKMVGVR